MRHYRENPDETPQHDRFAGQQRITISNLTPWQKDRIVSAIKWLERIESRRPELPDSLFDNTELKPLIQDLYRIANEKHPNSR